MENHPLGPEPLFDSENSIAEREAMVKNQIIARGITDPFVIRAMRNVPRHLFLPSEYRHLAYLDKAISIGFGQTISQPYIVAYILGELSLLPKEKVLEVGTGSGYLTALLIEMKTEVVSVEIVPELYRRASEILELWSPGCTTNHQIRFGDAYEFAMQKDMFTRFVSSACLPKIPETIHPFFLCLREGGLAVFPISGTGNIQHLVTLLKRNDRWEEKRRIEVKFVPLTGKGGLSDK
ncbi:putative protein-L-isoaspartate O-methyltransferase [Leptospira inadai serovar Lyme str. 10]|uniref:Protein-L-isoaspartate O-methyltransferase n=2 Tax=Leptospira inadai serovar Lyme TaxID=293084 RepID=V6HEY0_9LEPT|nr:protein-L-isoaspartate O-methyltransferase [Leptospira inadai]EQA38003.1 putative protein-L-isoaspartate O-methyltransferase [Leptospira inadai serovar Lyme str. 10]PNV74691.1 protein-L-isoaspartate O-methyltransferase [Leptospira inadai serovar Lyme]